MAASTIPRQHVDVHLAPVWRVDFPASQPPTPPQQPSPAAKAAEALQAEQQAQSLNQLVPATLLVEIDRASGRFVHTLKDSATNEVLWRFPSEGQLAFSRAVKAYTDAVVAE